MEAIIQEIDVEKLTTIFDIPEEMRNGRVEVTIRPIKNELRGTTAERLEQFRKKHNRETFVEQLKQAVERGATFDFDVQKVIDGTETEEEMEARHRKEKRTRG